MSEPLRRSPRFNGRGGLWVAIAMCFSGVASYAGDPGAGLDLVPAASLGNVEWPDAALLEQAVYDTLDRPPAGAFVVSAGTLIADDLRLAEDFELQAVTFALFNPAANGGVLDRATIEIGFYDLRDGQPLVTLSAALRNLGIPAGEYRLVTLDRRDPAVIATDETNRFDDPDWLVTDYTAVGVRVTGVGNRAVGLVVAGSFAAPSEDVGEAETPETPTSDDTFLVADETSIEWTSFGGDPAADFLWRITRSGPLATDCNNDGIADADQLETVDRYGNYIGDVNGNGVYDGCEPDCNANGIPDDWELATGAATDLDLNGRPDACDACPDEYRDPRESPCDCDGDGLFDSVQIRLFPERDRNGNGVIDSCEWLGDLATASGAGVPPVEAYNVDFFDIDPFVDALLGRLPEPDPVDVTDSYYRFDADINGDGVVDFHDVDPFVELLLAQ